MPPRYVALIGAASLTCGWLLASLLSPPVAELQALPDRTPSRAERAAPADAPYTEQLHLRLQAAPVAPTPRRNPFVFGSAAIRGVPTVKRPEEATEAAAAEAAPGTVATGPALRLAGIGSTSTADGIARTAVISDRVTVHLVKVGDIVAGYAVVEIAEDSVTIADAAGAQWRLRLP